MKAWIYPALLVVFLFNTRTANADCNTATPWGCTNQWIVGIVPDVVEVRDDGSIYFTKNGIGGNSWFKVFAGSDNAAVKGMLATLLTSRSSGLPLNIFISGGVSGEQFVFSVNRIQL